MPSSRRYAGWLLRMSEPSGWIRGAEGDVVVGEGGDQQRQLVRRCRHVGVGEDDEVGVGREHAGPDRGALAAVRDGQESQVGRPGLAVGLGPRERRGPPSRRCCRRRRRGPRSARAGRPRPARRRGHARRAGAGSRTARRGRGRCAPPRCRRAGRWSDWLRLDIAGSLRAAAVWPSGSSTSCNSNALCVPNRYSVSGRGVQVVPKSCPKTFGAGSPGSGSARPRRRRRCRGPPGGS